MEKEWITRRSGAGTASRKWRNAIRLITVFALGGFTAIGALGQAGRVDDGFSPELPPDSRAGSFRLLSDGTMVVLPEPTVVPWKNLPLRWLRPDGSLLRAVPSPFERVGGFTRLVLTPIDGKLLVAGLFAGSSPNGLRLIRLTPEGEIDPTFHQADFGLGGISGLGLQPDGKILVCGNFNQVDGFSRSGVARLQITGELDMSFDPDLWFGSGVTQVEVLGSGQLIIVGNFDANPSLLKRGLARLSSSGKVDRRWVPDVPDNTPFTVIAVQPDQRILVGGDLGTLLRLNANGTRDSSFQVGTAFGGLGGSVTALAVQPSDGRILVGGAFETYRGVYADGLVRVATNGAIDLAFDAGPIFPGDGLTRRIEQIVPASDGRLLVSGPFTTIGGRSRPGLARLLGGSETNHVPRFQFSASTLSVTEGATALVGRVSRLRSSAGAASVNFYTTTNLWFSVADRARPGLDYQETAGTLVFLAGETSKTFEIPILDDLLGEPEKHFGIVLAGASPGAGFGSPTNLLVTLLDNDASYGLAQGRSSFRESEPAIEVHLFRFGPTARAGTVRYRTIDGGAEAGQDYTATSGTASFVPGQTGASIRIPLLPDRIREGTETFRFVISDPTPSGTTLNPPSELEFNLVDDDDDGPGAPDVSFKPAYPGIVAFAPLPDGHAYVAATFDAWPIFGTNAVFRLDAQGNLDPTYASPDGLFTYFLRLAVNANGDALVYGMVRPGPEVEPAFGLAHLDHAGRLVDLIFRPEFSGQNVSALAWETEGSFLLGFREEAFRPSGSASLVRMDLQGRSDTSFKPELFLPHSIRAIAQQPDGDWIVAGDFTQVQGRSRPGLVRLKPDGRSDARFEPDILGVEGAPWVSSLWLQSDGKLLIAGALTRVDGRPVPGLARLLPTGRADPEFHPAAIHPSVLPYGGAIESMAVQSNGRIVLSGGFEQVGGLTRRGLVRLLPSGEVDPEFDQPIANQGSALGVSATGDLFVLAAQSFNFEDFPFTRLIQQNQAFPGRFEIEHSEYAALATNGVLRLNVVRRGGDLRSATVRVTTRDESARAGVDYLATSETLEFRPGERLKGLVIPLLPSRTHRPARRFEVQLELPTTAVLGTGSRAVVTLRDHWVGSVDPDFVLDPIVQTQIGRIAIANAGKILIDQPLAGNQFGDRRLLRRLNQDGSMDALFQASVQRNLVDWMPRNDGGIFAVLTDFSGFGVVRIEGDGQVESSFRPSLDFTASPPLAGPDGRLVGFRLLTTPEEGSLWKLSRLNPDGSEDLAFSGPTFRAYGFLLGFTPRHGLLLQGVMRGDSMLRFWGIDEQGKAHATGLPVDTSLYGSHELLPDGGLQGFMDTLVEGDVSLDYRLRRWLADGSEDPNFHSDITVEPTSPGAAGVVSQADGKLLVWGSGLRYGVKGNGDSLTASVLRLWPDGSIDPTFDPAADGLEYVAQLLPDSAGRILATPLRETFSQPRDARILRLLNDAPSASILELEPVGASVDEAAGEMWVEVHRLGVPRGPIAVAYSTQDRSARAGTDFQAVSGWLRWADGDAGVRRIRIPIVDDRTTEPTEEFVVGLGSPLGAAFWGSAALLQIAIRDQDVNLQFERSEWQVLETVGLARIGIVRSGPTGSAQSVRYATAQQTARAGIDYESASGVVNFEAGESTKTIELTVKANALADRDREFFVELSDPSPTASLGSTFKAVVRIMDVDRPGAVEPSFRVSPGFGMRDGSYHISDFALQRDGRIVAVWSSNQSPENSGLIRLEHDGSVDRTFASEAMNNVVPLAGIPRGIGISPSGQLYLGLHGGYQLGNDGPVWKLTPEGVRDASFQLGLEGANARVSLAALTVGPDGTPVITGRFPIELGIPESPWAGLLLLSSHGEVNTNFARQLNPVTIQDVQAVAVGTNQIVFGGDLRFPDWAVKSGLFRLKQDGSLDSGFQPRLRWRNTFNGRAESILLLPEGGVLVAGWFDSVNGVHRNGLALLDAQGRLDPTFEPDSYRVESMYPSLVLNALARQPDGKLIAAGYQSPGSGLRRAVVIRFMANGSLDPTFRVDLGRDPDLAGTPNCRLAMLGSDRVVLSGPFGSVNGEAFPGLVVLNTRNTSFLLGADLISGEKFRLRLQIATGEVAVVERSEDLRGWQAISTPLTSPVSEFFDLLPPGGTQHFYRLHIDHIGRTVQPVEPFPRR